MLLVIQIGADELSDREKELRKLKAELESAEKRVKETEAQKKKTQADLNRNANLKNQADAKARNLQKTERVVQDSLQAATMRIQLVESNLEDLKTYMSNQMKVFIRRGKTVETDRIRQKQRHILSRLIYNTKRNIDIIEGFKSALAQDREMKNREFVKVRTQLSTEHNRIKQYDRKIQTLSKEDQKLSQQQRDLQARINKLKADAAALENLINQLTVGKGKQPSSYQFTTKKIGWPVRGKIIRNYGQETREGGTSVISNGIDIAVPEGTNVQAVDDGEVVFADRYGGQGRLIIIDHKNGFFSVYAYNSELVAGKGTKVKKGQVIAKSGMTGSASQPSLHFELRKDGAAVNPLAYLE